MSKPPKNRLVSNIDIQQPITIIKRFDISQRIEHLVLLVSFTILGITGLAQKYAFSLPGGALLSLLGGIETTRKIHHASAIVLGAVSSYHIIEVLYRIIVLRTELNMIPTIDDFKQLFQDIGYYLNLRERKAFYGRYNYAEKVEYFAVVWGTIIMGITGFMMWNPIATTQLLPGEYIPAAKAAHGGEAVLAVLAIILWHFYHVHLRHFNKSMFTGKITQEEMEEDHPAELIELQQKKTQDRISLKTLRHRQQIFFPVATVLSLVFISGLYKFVTFEKTAIATVPQAETAPVYVPITPTSRPTPTITPTIEPGKSAAVNTWNGTFEELFRNRCKTCHITTAVNGLSLATYQNALKGGNSGPAIVPGNPDASVLVKVQSTGNHPGQLTVDELNEVIAWIKAGAPEN
jgi:cytochrome b subunit of formate dehydrogenase